MSDDPARTVTDRSTRRLPDSSPEVRRRLRHWFDGGFRGSLLGVGLFALLIGCWQAAVVVSGLPAVVLPSPLEVGVALVDLRWTLAADAGTTALTAWLGLTAGLVVGSILAFVMAVSRPAAAVVLPYVVALRIAPLVAIAPLLFLWFGRGIPGKALLVTTLTVFPITIAALDGPIDDARVVSHATSIGRRVDDDRLLPRSAAGRRPERVRRRENRGDARRYRRCRRRIRDARRRYRLPRVRDVHHAPDGGVVRCTRRSLCARARVLRCPGTARTSGPEPVRMSHESGSRRWTIR